MQEFTQNVINVIKQIPSGKVSTYGQIATMAGNPRAARQVSRILHTMSRKYNLPWHRIINSQGKIAIKDPAGAEEQRALLANEGIEISSNFSVDLKKYAWS